MKGNNRGRKKEVESDRNRGGKNYLCTRGGGGDNSPGDEVSQGSGSDEREKSTAIRKEISNLSTGKCPKETSSLGVKRAVWGCLKRKKGAYAGVERDFTENHNSITRQNIVAFLKELYAKEVNLLLPVLLPFEKRARGLLRKAPSRKTHITPTSDRFSMTKGRRILKTTA